MREARGRGQCAATVIGQYSPMGRTPENWPEEFLPRLSVGRYARPDCATIAAGTIARGKLGRYVNVWKYEPIAFVTRVDQSSAQRMLR